MKLKFLLFMAFSLSCYGMERRLELRNSKAPPKMVREDPEKDKKIKGAFLFTGKRCEECLICCIGCSLGTAVAVIPFIFNPCFTKVSDADHID